MLHFFFLGFALKGAYFATPPRAPGLQTGLGLPLHGQPAVLPLPVLGRAQGPLSTDQGQGDSLLGALPWLGLGSRQWTESYLCFLLFFGLTSVVLVVLGKGFLLGVFLICSYTFL